MGYLKQIAEQISAHSCLSTADALNALLTFASCRLQRNQGAMFVRRYFGI